MLAPMKTQYDKSGPTLVKAMKKRQFDAYYCSTAEEAVEKVLEFYGISKADSMAFGDGNNDLEMFGAVGTGVAMGNASEKLKAAAAAHCRTVMEDGIYWYCLEQGLITT